MSAATLPSLVPEGMLDPDFPAAFLAATAYLREGGDPAERNLCRADLSPLAPGTVEPLPPRGSEERRRLTEQGLGIVARGEVATMVLGGGMATRFGSVVKATSHVSGEVSFLELKLRDAEALRRETGGTVPFVCLTSFATDAAIRAAMASWADSHATAQFAGPRLELDGELFLESGAASLNATGHGDLLRALSRRGVAAELRARGVRTLYVSNVDNVAATLDPALVALHARSGAKVTVEVAPKYPGDRGGAPALVDGVPGIVEGFRFPPTFAQDAVRVFNTNTALIDLALAEDPPVLDYFLVEKTLRGRRCIQLERLVGQVAEKTRTHLVEVSREGLESRFFPVKEVSDLERDRGAIEALLADRRLLAR